MSDRNKAFLAILFGSLFGGAVTTVIKIGLIEIPPLTFSFLRFFIASIVLLPIIIKHKNISVKNLKILAPFTLFATFNVILFIFGIRHTTATIGQLLYAGVPFLTGIITLMVFGDRLSSKKTFGIIVGFIGVAIVVLLPIIEQGKQFSGNLTGNVLIIAGVISWSLYMVFSKKLSKEYSPFVINSAFILITAFVLFPFSVFELIGENRWISQLSLAGIVSLGYVAIFGTVLNYLLNQYAIKHGGSVFASTSFYLLPIFAFLAAFILLGERLTSGLFIGGALVLLGIFLTTRK